MSVNLYERSNYRINRLEPNLPFASLPNAVCVNAWRISLANTTLCRITSMHTRRLFTLLLCHRLGAHQPQNFRGIERYKSRPRPPPTSPTRTHIELCAIFWNIKACRFHCQHVFPDLVLFHFFNLTVNLNLNV